MARPKIYGFDFDEPEMDPFQFLPDEYREHDPGAASAIPGANADRNPADLADAAANRGIGGASSAGAGGFNLEKMRKAWTQPGIGARVSMAELQKFMNDNRDFTTGVTLKGEKAYDPSGRYIADMIGNYRGGKGDPNQMTRIFLDGVGSNGGPRPTPTPTPTPMPTGPTNTGGQPATPTPTPTIAAPTHTPTNASTASTPTPALNEGVKSPYDSAIYEMIMALMKRGSTPVATDDPGIQSQFAPVSATMQRGAERAKLAAAERATFQGASHGGAGGSLDAKHAGIDEDLAMDEGTLMSGLIRDEMAARRQELVQGLAFAQGEEKVLLTLKLAEMDDVIKRMGLQQQQKQFDTNLRQQDRHFGQNMNYRNRALDQNRYIFDEGNRDQDDRFDWDRYIWEYEANRKLQEDARRSAEGSGQGGV